MSNINISRTIENIRAITTVYTPIVEVIVNSIQAIESNGGLKGAIAIRVHRAAQLEMDDSLSEIDGFEIEDNGVGFTDEHRNSFDTLYSDLKITAGGKGFGRFTCLKYFDGLDVESVYPDKDRFGLRKFSMGKGHDIIVNESISISAKHESGTIIRLTGLRQGKSIDKKLNTIARILVEKLLPYFITKDYACPSLVLSEANGAGKIQLNDFVTNDLSAVIKEISIEHNTFELKGNQSNESFLVRVFKLYFPKNQKSKISLVAHRREVSGSSLHNYIPEFADDFYDKDSSGGVNHEKNYIIKAYVFSDYLNRNVSLERSGFEFEMESDIVLGISQVEIERASADIAKDAVGSDIRIRQEKKKERVQSYVDDEAPWHKSLLGTIDLSGMPYNPSNEEIEARLQKEKFGQEVQIKKDITKLLAGNNLEKLQSNVLEVVSRISGTSKNDLVHYVALRRNILDLFEKSLQRIEKGAYKAEGIVHDIIFPRKGDSDITSFEDHNLWLLDERLNFTSYLSSDVPLNGGTSERVDLLTYDKRILFRGDNEASNPVTIFEFKKPQRDDFVNPSSKEDPVQQIVRYVNNIRDGKFKTPKGRDMLVASNTPFYGYVVCDLTDKVKTWLEREKDFKPMPDRLGWFKWIENINLYVEVISWDKVVKDAKMRNQVFFHKLGI
jgi:hypothetical protein